MAMRTARAGDLTNKVGAMEAKSKVIVWIGLPRLPTNYWKRSEMVRISAIAGTLVSMDTSEQSAGNSTAPQVARIFVQVGVHKQLAPGAWLGSSSKKSTSRGGGGGIWQPFVYEIIGLYDACSRCHRLLHTVDTCTFPERCNYPPLQVTTVLPRLSARVNTRREVAKDRKRDGEEYATVIYYGLGRRRRCTVVMWADGTQRECEIRGQQLVFEVKPYDVVVVGVGEHRDDRTNVVLRKCKCYDVDEVSVILKSMLLLGDNETVEEEEKNAGSAACGFSRRLLLVFLGKCW